MNALLIVYKVSLRFPTPFDLVLLRQHQRSFLSPSSSMATAKLVAKEEVAKLKLKQLEEKKELERKQQTQRRRAEEERRRAEEE